MAAGNGDRAVAETEPLHEWAAMCKTAPHSLNFSKILITASSPQAFNKTCNSLEKQLTTAYQGNTPHQHLSSEGQQPGESLPEHLPH